MSAKAWMPLWIGDYLGDTKRLSLEEHGAYLLLLMDYWRNGSPPDDDATLARILGVGLREWRRIRPVIARYFAVQEGRWLHKRVELERAGAEERSGKAAAKAKAAAESRWRGSRGGSDGHEPSALSNAPSIPTGTPQAVHMQCPSPVTYSSPSEKAASAPLDPGKEAWQRAVALLTTAGRMRESAARSLFGRLLKENSLEARDLLASVVKGETNGTQDPQSYLTACAKAVARVRSPAAVPDVATWGDDEWRTALRFWREDGSWSDKLGPKPGEPGCRVPAHLLLGEAA